MQNTAGFEKIAPFLTHPLVLVGFALLLSFGFFRALLKADVIPKLDQTGGGRLAMRLITYAFVLAVLIIILGFCMEAYHLHKQTDSLENSLSVDISQVRSDMAKMAWYKRWDVDAQRSYQGVIVQASEIAALDQEKTKASLSGNKAAEYSADMRLKTVAFNIGGTFPGMRNTDLGPESLKTFFEGILSTYQRVDTIIAQIRNELHINTEDTSKIEGIEAELGPLESLFQLNHFTMYYGDVDEIIRLSVLVTKYANSSPTSYSNLNLDHIKAVLTSSLNELDAIIKRN